MKTLRSIAFLAMTATVIIASAKDVEWCFPLDKSCHEGMAFADGVTGVLVWGGGDTVKITVGRADLWDHRGGYPWTPEQSYTNIVSAVKSGDKDRLLALFKKETPDGEPRNPYMLPLGRVTVTVPKAELKSGTLDPKTGLGTLSFERDGKTWSAMLAMSKMSHAFVLKFPEDVGFSVVATPAMKMPIARESLLKVGFVEPVPFASADHGGFVQELPADPSVSLEWWKSDGELEVKTFRGRKGASSDVAVGYGKVHDESVAQWKSFWDESARVEIPDEVLQRVFDYGMYRFGAMTDPDGVPAGLQGSWLEDDRLVPWNGDYHFNINVQECYSPAYRGGHVKNLLPLFRMVKSWWPRLRNNARKFCGIDDGFVLPHSVDDRGICIGGFWTGTIDHGSTAWVAAMMFRYVKYSRDFAFLRSDAYPFMKGAMNVYRAMMEECDGRLSIPLGPSPEWGGRDVSRAVGRDPSFQLAAAHRLCRDLIAAARMLGEEPDAMWLDVEKHLPLYTAGKGGFHLFEGQPFNESHRHHSHMAGLYPFDILDLDDAAVRKDVVETYRTWTENGTGNWTGWCVPWASILNTHVGNATAAGELLRCWDAYYCNLGHGSLHNAYAPGFTSRTIFGSFAGSGEGQIMQMDGQCAAVSAILEMMVHEVNGKEEYFKGCPISWRRVAFENVLTSSGRRVSGVRENGKVEVR